MSKLSGKQNKTTTPLSSKQVLLSLDLWLPSAVCPVSSRRRVALSSASRHSCPLKLLLPVILKSTRNEMPQGQQKTNLPLIDEKFSWHCHHILFAFMLRYPHVLMSHNDPWHFPNDAWALPWHGVSKSSCKGTLPVSFDVFPLETGY